MFAAAAALLLSISVTETPRAEFASAAGLMEQACSVIRSGQQQLATTTAMLWDLRKIWKCVPSRATVHYVWRASVQACRPLLELRTIIGRDTVNSDVTLKLA